MSDHPRDTVEVVGSERTWQVSINGWRVGLMFSTREQAERVQLWLTYSLGGLRQLMLANQVVGETPVPALAPAPTPTDLTLADVQRLIDQHQQRLRIHHAGSEAEKLRAILAHYHDVATNQLEATRTFRDDLLVALRAMSMIVDMTGSAHTHREKAARLRGMSEVIEATIEKLRRMTFDIQRRYGHWPDVFASDYPTRHLLAEIDDLKRRLAQHEPQAVAVPVDGEGNHDGYDF